MTEAHGLGEMPIREWVARRLARYRLGTVAPTDFVEADRILDEVERRIRRRIRRQPDDSQLWPEDRDEVEAAYDEGRMPI